MLFDFFKTLNTGEPENEGDPPVFNQDTDDLNNIINAPITIDEIKSAMKNLKNNKASGEDLIANEYLKHSFEIMSDIYVKLFNLIFDKGLIPEQWLYGDIQGRVAGSKTMCNQRTSARGLGAAEGPYLWKTVHFCSK